VCAKQFMRALHCAFSQPSSSESVSSSLWHWEKLTIPARRFYAFQSDRSRISPWGVAKAPLIIFHIILGLRKQPIALKRSAIGIFTQPSDMWLATRIRLEERNDGSQAASSSPSNSSGSSSSSISANPGSSSGSAGAAVGVVASVGISKRLAGFCSAGSAGLAEGAF